MGESSRDFLVDLGGDGLSSGIVCVRTGRCASEDAALSDMHTLGSAHVVYVVVVDLLGPADDGLADAWHEASAPIDNMDLVLEGDDRTVRLDVTDVVRECGGIRPKSGVVLRVASACRVIVESQAVNVIVDVHRKVDFVIGTVDVVNLGFDEQLTALVEVGENTTVFDVFMPNVGVAAHDTFALGSVNEFFSPSPIDYGDFFDVLDARASGSIGGVVENWTILRDDLILGQVHPLCDGTTSEMKTNGELVRRDDGRM